MGDKPMTITSPYAILPAKVVLVLTGSASSLALWQASTPVPDLGFIGQMERLSLVGVLISAVVVLWRKLDAKDTAFAEISTKMINALVLNNQLMIEMRTESKDNTHNLTETVSELRDAINQSVTVREAVEDIRSKRPR